MFLTVEQVRSALECASYCLISSESEVMGSAQHGLLLSCAGQEAILLKQSTGLKVREWLRFWDEIGFSSDSCTGKREVLR